MGGYVRGRALVTVPLLLGVSLVVFSMLHLLPGDPVMLMMAESGGGAKMADGSEEQYERIRHELGLDLPLPVQFGRFVLNALRGDLGRSFRSGQSVSQEIGEVFPNTVRLAVLSLGVAASLGLVLGTLAALYHQRWIDNASMLLALVGVAMPNFWFGLMLLFVFALMLGWLPATGYGEWNAILLPAAALGLRAAAVIARLTRSSLLEVLRNDYVTTARAKGLSERAMVVRHALRNALIPVVTVVGLQFGDLLAGTVVIETVFARPGLGSLATTAILSKDFPIVQGTVLVVASCYIFVNLLADLSYAALDPRIKYG
ncbi:MAG TPA: ABC transporter permease [Chloroflexota bacterium]|jgi:ABC-type dipeptide/oligopeptide/nickel transport system permease component